MLNHICAFAVAANSSRWASLVGRGVTPAIELLRQRGIEGKIASQDDASLRWIQWKLFLTEHISSIPSSWHAVLQRDRDAYNELRSRLLRAPDGNYPPEVGFDGRHTTLESALTGSTSSQKRQTPAVTHDLSVNNPLSLDDSNPWKTYYSTLETRRVILQDVERTFPDLPLFRQVRVQQSLTNILFLWALQNEDVGYRQGMHELAAVLWKVRSDGAVDSRRAAATQASRLSTQATDDAPFDHALADVFVEHDVYALFAALMQSAESWYAWRQSSGSSPPTSPSANPLASANARQSLETARRPLPIVVKCEYILDLLRRLDPALAQHLESLGIEPQIFCLRWIRMIFTREFGLDDAISIWDGLFASGRSLALIDYVCIAMLLRIRNQLLAGDHTSALQSLLRYPPEAQAQPSLLIQQAIFMQKSSDRPGTGVAVVMQNRDLLGIPVQSMPAPDEAVPSNSSPARAQRLGGPKFATVGRAASGPANRVSPWSRLEQDQSPRGGSPAHHASPDARRWQPPAAAGDPLGALPQSSSSVDANGARAFGINPAAYVPEGISDFAKGWYERAELPQSLNSALVNVSRSVAAAAAAGVAGAYRGNKPETSGFPSGFDQAFSSQAALRTTGSAATVGHAASEKKSRPALSVMEAAEPAESVPASTVRASPSVSMRSKDAAEEASDPLAKLTAANKAIGSALSVCIQVLEQSWLDRSAAPRPDELEQNDINTLMSFTALKHIRDVLGGTAAEFDPATLPVATASKRPVSQPQSADQAAPRPVPAADVPPPTPMDTQPPAASHDVTIPPTVPPPKTALPMSLGEYARYGRQMILPDFGLDGQLRLRRAKVLVVGAGGLGCPAIQYLAAAGVGRISILDHDVVEPSNLARQILHSEHTVGMAKAVSAAQAAQRINPHITALPLQYALTAANARELMRGQDLVLDCTDNPLTRYLVSDAAVLEGVQVVSGAAQGYDGQLVVLHKRIKAEFAGPKATAGTDARGPCYRCLFPKAPRPDEVTNCEDGGVLGGVTGLVGTMQALEATKILAGIGEDTPPMLTLVAPMTGTPFRSVKIRPRRIATCRACGDPAQVAETMITDLEQEDYASFCGLNAVPIQGDELQRIAVSGMHPRALVVDVRPKVEFGITRLDRSLNVPIQQLLRDPQSAWDTITHEKDRTKAKEVLVVCKKGNDSQLAVRSLLQLQRELRAEKDTPAETSPSHPLDLSAHSGAQAEAKREPHAELKVSDLIGGLRAYAAANPGFPVY